MAYGNEIFKEHGEKILEMNREGLELISFSAGRFWWVDIFPPSMYSLPAMMLCLTSILSAVHPLLVSRGYISTDREKVQCGSGLHPL